MGKSIRFDNEFSVALRVSGNPYKRHEGVKGRNTKANKATRKNYERAA